MAHYDELRNRIYIIIAIVMVIVIVNHSYCNSIVIESYMIIIHT